MKYLSKTMKRDKMTCIIGLVENGKIIMGGDSGGFCQDFVQIRKDKKVFKKGKFIIGFSSSFRMGQLLQYTFVPPKQNKKMDDMEYMVNYFIPSIKECFDENEFFKVVENEKYYGDFLIGYKGVIYEVCADLQVAIPEDQISSIGSGFQAALAAMYAFGDLWSPEERIKKTLGIVSKINTNVKAPFIVEII